MNGNAMQTDGEVEHAKMSHLFEDRSNKLKELSAALESSLALQMTSKDDLSLEYCCKSPWTMDAQDGTVNASNSNCIVPSPKGCNTPIRAKSPQRFSSPSTTIDNSLYPRLSRGFNGFPPTFSPVITAKAQQLVPEKPFHIRLYQHAAEKTEPPNSARGRGPQRSGQAQPRSHSAEVGSRRGKGKDEALVALYQEAFERRERMQLRRALAEEQAEAERNSRKVSKASEGLARRRLEKELGETWESFVAIEGGGQERLEAELQSISYPQLQRLLRGMGFFASLGDKPSAIKEEEKIVDKLWCAMNVAGLPSIRFRDFMRVMSDLLDPKVPRKVHSNAPSKPAAAEPETAASDIGWEVTPIEWDNKGAAETVNAVAAALHLTTSSTFAYSPVKPNRGVDSSLLQGLDSVEKLPMDKTAQQLTSLAAILPQKFNWRHDLNFHRLHRSTVATPKVPVDAESEECTFQPTINEHSRRLGEANEEHWLDKVATAGGKLGREDLLYERDRQAKQKLEELRQQRQCKEVEGCTFHPAIRSYVPPKRIDRPVAQTKASRACTKAKSETQETTEEREVKEFCTFKPVVKAYDNSKKNSIRTENVIVGYDDHLRRLSQAKEERQQRRRWADNLRHAAGYASKVPEGGEKCTVPRPFHFHLDDRQRSRPLLYVDVDLGEGKTGRLGIHASDTPSSLAKEFASIHKLDDALCLKLERLLAKQIEQLQTGTRDKACTLSSCSTADRSKEKPNAGQMPRGVLMEPQAQTTVLDVCQEQPNAQTTGAEQKPQEPPPSRVDGTFENAEVVEDPDTWCPI